MSRRGRQLSWLVIVAASAVIVGYLAKYGGPSYARSAGPSAAPAVAALPATPPREPTAPPPARPATTAPIEKATPEPTPRTGGDVRRPPAPTVIAPPAHTPEPAAVQPPRVEPTPAPGIDPSQAPPDAPRITFDETEHDFGVVYQEELHKYEFTFTNTGKSPLKITNSYTSCGGCVVTKSPEKEISPGEKAGLEIAFDTGRLRNRVTKYVFVTSNDPVTPRVALAVKAEVKVEVDIQPSGIYFRRLSPGESVERSVLLVPADVKQFKVLRVESPDPQIALTVPVEKLKPGREGVYTLTFRIGPFPEQKRVDVKVKVTMDLKHRPVQTIPIYGRVADEPAAPAPDAKQLAP